MSRYTHALVAIPAHDEEEHIEACLNAVFTAAQLSDVHVEVVVALDKCSDHTALILDRLSHDLHALEFSFAAVGRSRHAGITAGLVILRDVPKENIWIFNTDADSLVPPSWIQTHLSYASSADVVAGTVAPDWGGTPPELIAAYEARYQARPGHPHVHGTNLSFSASAYLEVGGFPFTKESEDVALVKEFEQRGYAIARIAEDPVSTSTRESDRTPGGFSGYLENLSAECL
ncbi:glycosyltransferase [Staphylococcus chromogenes]|nr:glycosyltransferase [Staphylococcus chromogenes]